jgi:PAS domain S-box-containing protein
MREPQAETGALTGQADMDDLRANILIVDDRVENLLALEAILEPLQQRIVRALSGREALRELMRNDFAVILMDVQMPELNGFETAEIIKSRERSRYTPIIFLTAISKDDEYVYSGYNVGAVDYMFKPLQPDILRSKVAVFVDLYLKSEELKRQQSLLRESERREEDLRHAAELREQTARSTQIVEAAMDAIVVFGADHAIQSFNVAAEEMFGVAAERALGTPFETLIGPGSRDRFEQMLRDRRESLEAPAPDQAPRSAGMCELSGLHADGSEFPMEVSVSLLQLPAGIVHTVIARDISKRRQQEERLQSQAKALAKTMEDLRAANAALSERQRELEQAISARSRFYANMSHELRTPINAIMGYSSLMLDQVYGPMSEQQARGVERTFLAAQHLLELVNDVLDLSKHEAGKMEVEGAPMDFPSVIDDLFVTLKPLLDKYECELTLDARSEPRVIVTDPRRVRQIMLNLLSNAIKFGDGNPVRVLYEGTDDGGVRISVIDRGPGIAEEDRSKIFEEFVQLKQENRMEGTGLGLPISLRLAHLLGGELTLDSTVGEGSTFTLVLPQSLDLGDSQNVDAA